MNEQIKKRLDDFVVAKGLRQTNQRNLIAEEIFSTDEHFTADDLLDRLRSKPGKSSRATVYRTLSLLVEADLLHEIDLGDGMVTYDPNFNDRPSHNHLICIDCGQIEEFEDSHLDTLNDCLSRRLGFKAVKQTLKIEACCEKLRATGTCANLIKARLNGKRMPTQKR